VPDATFKDLCIDVGDVATAAAFYVPLLGLRVDPDRSAKLVGERAEHTVWLNAVPEPRTVKNRVHLDVHAAGVDELLALGARVDTEHPGWTVLRDPEGQEFCGFWRDEVPAYRLFELVVDAADPEASARWWAGRFGAEVRHDAADPWWWIDAGEAGLPWDLVLNPVPEPRTGKNRVHWDVWGDPDALVAAGARWVRRRDAETDWDVLADPEGNEFCVFAPAP
jgi:catechol 2,3-dioxygenase-like lactoylglutathione lyase family enzyme